MSGTIIRVNSLWQSVPDRVEEKRSDTIAGSILQAVKAPFRNFAKPEEPDPFRAR